MDDSPETPESVANDTWDIKTRWLQTTGLGKDARLLLDVIREEIPEGHRSGSHTDPPHWQISRLYELLKGRMSQIGLENALKELHHKGILQLAYAWHAVSVDRKSLSHNRLTGLYKTRTALHEEIKRREATDMINIARIEIYLVLPEDDTILA